MRPAPGPWRVSFDNDRRADVFSAGNPYVLATVYESSHDGNARENARLIAAAPTLLDALRSLVARVDSIELPDGSTPDTLGAHVAISMAEHGCWPPPEAPR